MLMTLQEVASLLKISISTAHYYKNKKGMPYVKIGRHVRIESDKLREWINSQRVIGSSFIYNEMDK